MYAVDAVHHPQHRRRGTAASCGSVPRLAFASSSLVQATAPSRRGMPTWFASAGLAKNPKYVVPLYTVPFAVPHQHVVVLDDHAGRVRHAGHLHGGGQRAAVRRDRAELRRLAAEVAEAQVVVAGERRAAVRGQPPARLEGDLQQDAERHVLARGSRRSTTRPAARRTRRSHAAPAFSTNGSPVTAVMRSRNWYGGPGSRAMTRSESNTRYGSPNASDGLPLENAMMLGGVVQGFSRLRLRGCFIVRVPRSRKRHCPHLLQSLARQPGHPQLMLVISTIGLPSAYIRASAMQNGSGP